METYLLLLDLVSCNFKVLQRKEIAATLVQIYKYILNKLASNKPFSSLIG